ncbi:MAG TPA: hypothetical protein PLU58_06005 [Saprospiraceae bacterium]|jgi:hypothetical protein|nr:hypothetical protein [Saprospiraceae bacterium]
MQVSSLQQWAKGNRDYQSGVALLKCFSTNRALVMILERKETRYNRDLLTKEIIKLCAKPEFLQHEQKSEKKVKQIISDDEYLRADDAIKDIVSRSKTIYKHCAVLHHKLVMITDEAIQIARKEKRQGDDYYHRINELLSSKNTGDLCNELLDKEDELNELYFEIDYWKKFGKLPGDSAKAKIEDEDKFTIQKKLNNVRSTISKVKKNEKRKGEIPELEAMRNALELKLNELI